ncbi:MAG: hypothetical protein NVSMB19_03900 [Vulcanimicrobiaceae bacterium]
MKLSVGGLAVSAPDVGLDVAVAVGVGIALAVGLVLGSGVTAGGGTAADDVGPGAGDGAAVAGEDGGG